MPTPATAQFVPAVEQQDWPTALELLDEHWVEIWYAIDPADLRQALAQAPAHLLATLRSANYIARVTGHGPVEDLLEPELTPGRNATPGEIAQLVADLRLRGRPVQAMSYVRRAQALVRAQRGQLVDGSGGAAALWLVQAAITALLAGDVASAKGMLLTALGPHRTDRFPFVIREATAKLALVHAVAGDITEAAQLNEQARLLPRTESWVEALVDDTIWLTDYACAVDTLDPRAETMRQAKGSPMAHLEFWPVALLVQVRHLVLTGRTGQAEELCDAVAAAGLPPADAEGIVATAITDARASIPLREFTAADRERRSVRTAETELARALHLFTTGQFQHVVELGALPATADERPARALSLLRAQSLIALGHLDAGRHLLLATVRQVRERRTSWVLSYLTQGTADSIRDTVDGARAADLIRQCDVPTVEVRAVLKAPLTEAEIDVLRLLRQGLTREEIAERLFLSVNTVKTQLRSAYRKLGASTRVEALGTVARLNL